MEGTINVTEPPGTSLSIKSQTLPPYQAQISMCLLHLHLIVLVCASEKQRITIITTDRGHVSWEKHENSLKKKEQKGKLGKGQTQKNKNKNSKNVII